MSLSDAGAIHWDGLVAAAFRAQTASYSPYSHYRVGAALLAEDGRVFVGTNVENASYGLSLCAERSAMAAAVVAGARRFTAIAIVSPGETPATPCGMCRQVLAELGSPFAVRCVSENGTTIDTSTDELLPFAFTPAVLEARRAEAAAAAPRPAPAPAAAPRAPRPSLRSLASDDDPLRSTQVMGSTDDERPARSTERPPPATRAEAFVAGVALKAAAGTGEELAKKQQEAEKAAADAASKTKPEGE